MTERRPRPGEWTFAGPLTTPGSIASSVWRSGPITVVSSLQMADLPDRSGVGPQWHVSISNSGKRPKPHHVRRALRAFGMVGAEEDNHHPGNARHFWLPCDPAHRVDCECKVDEVTIVEPDGYRWTNPVGAAALECRGCEHERVMATLGRAAPCPIHLPGTARR